jgi:hypothetical protein
MVRSVIYAPSGRHRGDPHLRRPRMVAASLVQSKLLARIHTTFNL